MRDASWVPEVGDMAPPAHFSLLFYCVVFFLAKSLGNDLASVVINICFFIVSPAPTLLKCQPHEGRTLSALLPESVETSQFKRKHYRHFKKEKKPNAGIRC